MQHGASVNLCNAQGNTALHEAVVGRHEALVALLLQSGALGHLRNERSCSPADCAQPVSLHPPAQGTGHDSKQALLPSQRGWHAELHSAVMGGVNTELPVRCTACESLLWPVKPACVSRISYPRKSESTDLNKIDCKISVMAERAEAMLDLGKWTLCTNWLYWQQRSLSHPPFSALQAFWFLLSCNG